MTISIFVFKTILFALTNRFDRFLVFCPWRTLKVIHSETEFQNDRKIDISYFLTSAYIWSIVAITGLSRGKMSLRCHSCMLKQTKDLKQKIASARDSEDLESCMPRQRFRTYFSRFKIGLAHIGGRDLFMCDKLYNLSLLIRSFKILNFCVT